MACIKGIKSLGSYWFVQITKANFLSCHLSLSINNRVPLEQFCLLYRILVAENKSHKFKTVKDSQFKNQAVLNTFLIVLTKSFLRNGGETFELYQFIRNFKKNFHLPVPPWRTRFLYWCSSGTIIT